MRTRRGCIQSRWVLLTLFSCLNIRRMNASTDVGVTLLSEWLRQRASARNSKRDCDISGIGVSHLSACKTISPVMSGVAIRLLSISTTRILEVTLMIPPDRYISCLERMS